MVRATSQNRVHRQGLPAGSGGFALITALMLMGFVLLLCLSLTTLSRLEMASMGTGREVLIARENARLGLVQALGELQRVAGPDQRVTARAEILGATGANGGNRYWTGVWTPGQSAQPPVWLVSGNAPDPAVLPTNSVPLVPGNTALGLPAVRVEKIYFDRPSGGRDAFAWWVGDEGVKASLAPGREVPDGLSLEAAKALANQTPNGVDLAGLVAPEVQSDDMFQSDLRKLTGREALALVSTTAGARAIRADYARNSFHDYTPCAYGVLENPDTGGLKHNLSDDGYRDGFVNDALQAFLTPAGENEQADLQAKNHDPKPGEPVYALYPVPTEVVLYIGLFHTWSDAKIRIRYHVEVEFWNPYSVPIHFPAGEVAADGGELCDRSIVVCFENMPEIEIEDRDNKKVPDLEDDLDEFMAYDKDENRRYINGWMDISPLDEEGGAPVLMPGEVYRVLAPDPLKQPRGVARGFCFNEEDNGEYPDGMRWADRRGTRPEYNDEIKITLDHPSKGVTLSFMAFEAEDTNYRERKPFFKIENLDYGNKKSYRQIFRNKHDPEEIVPEGTPSDEKNWMVHQDALDDGYLPFSLPASLKYTKDLYTIAYHYKLKGDADDLSSLLSTLDPRSPVIDAEGSFKGTDGKTHRMKEFVETELMRRTDPDDELDAFDEDDFFHDETPREHGAGDRQLVLYDVPRSEPVSVGVLRSAQIEGVPPLAIGNPEAEGFNGVFDYYFMSPLAAANASGRRLLNPWLTPRDAAGWRDHLAQSATPASDDATRLLLAGAFNLNSTSVEAWQSVLAASRQAAANQLEPMGAGKGTEADSLPAQFYRLPFYAAWSDDPLIVPADGIEGNNAYVSAGRTLDEDAGENQLYYLAQGVVETLRTRQRPFATVAEFANAGVLEEAIEAVGQSRGTDLPRINANVPEISNLYLRQGDIVAGLAPLLSVRSDTFIIRACGEHVNALSGTTSRAWCEATVRRLPERMDGGDAMELADAGSLGRRFELISFRWLDASEIE